MHQPLVSLCMSSYNNAQYAVATLESLRAQIYPNIEIIVIDDFSTDDSVQVIEQWLATCGVPHRFVRHERNLGVCRVANDMIDNARGEYISIIASDDIMHSDKISSQVPILEAASSEVGVVYSDVTKIDSKGNVIDHSVYATGQIIPAEGNIWLHMLRTNFIPAMTALIRRACFERMGPFDETLAYEDWDMWLRISRDFKFIYQPNSTCDYRIHGSSFMHKRYRQLLESNMRILSKHLGMSAEGDTVIRQHFVQYSEELYRLGSTESVRWLKERRRLYPDRRGLALLWLARLGIPADALVRAKAALSQLVGKSKKENEAA